MMTESSSSTQNCGKQFISGAGFMHRDSGMFVALLYLNVIVKLNHFSYCTPHIKYTVHVHALNDL